MKRNFKLEIVAGIIILFTISCNNFTPKKEQLATIDTIVQTVDSSITTNNDFSETGSGLMEKEKLGDMAMGLSYSETIEKLGEPEEKTEPEIWGADGEYHQTLKYNSKGIELDLVGEKEENRKINMITISSQCNLKTSRGIGIGSNYKDVESAYKEEIDKESSGSETIVAGSIYGGVIFQFENNKVKSIFIGASAE